MTECVRSKGFEPEKALGGQLGKDLAADLSDLVCLVTQLMRRESGVSMGCVLSSVVTDHEWL